VPGQGSTFWFTATLEVRPQSALALPIPRDDLVGLRVLVVDDNETNRSILRALASSWKMESEGCEDAVTALAMLAHASDDRPYDMAIIDMQMPGMDGLQLARIIRRDSRFGNLPLVMMTSVGVRGS